MDYFHPIRFEEVGIMANGGGPHGHEGKKAKKGPVAAKKKAPGSKATAGGSGSPKKEK